MKLRELLAIRNARTEGEIQLIYSELEDDWQPLDYDEVKEGDEDGTDEAH